VARFVLPRPRMAHRLPPELPPARPSASSLDDLARAATSDHAAGECPPALVPARARDRRRAALGAAMACAAIAVLTVPAAVRSVAVPTMRHGVQESDADLDRCVDELWRIAATMQQTSPAAVRSARFREPGSGTPYVVTGDGAAFAVECPEPSRHGLTALRVRYDAPVPEAIR
jgi:hypothetical protein